MVERKQNAGKRKSSTLLNLIAIAVVVWATSDFWWPYLKDSTNDEPSPVSPAPRVAANGVEIASFSPENAETGERRVATINGVEFAFRYCPPGEFLMGSPEGEGNDNERPRHNVRISQGFWLMETELTQEQWKAATRENPSSFFGANLPVETISWDDCHQLIDKLNKGLDAVSGDWRFALPTEAQWEYACRAGTTGPRYGELGDIARYAKNSGGRIRPVGALAPNAWGLRDMLGNVWEWCEDKFENYSTDLRTRQYIGSGNKVNRGGGWGSGSDLTAATRSWNSSGARFDFLGARLALVPPPVPETTSDVAATEDGDDRSGQAREEDAPKELDAETEKEPETDEPKGGDRRVLEIEGVEFAFRYCPPGEFMMGNKEGKEGDEDWPQHKVVLTKGFWLMETEVTQAQWEAITGKNPCRTKGIDLPVGRISWNDCNSFVDKLNDELRAAPEGLRFSLPTEAQWEYAARAGTTGERYGELDEIAWHMGTMKKVWQRRDDEEFAKGRSYFDPPPREPCPVGLKKPNAWKLYDMVGNVWEYCEDYYGEYPSGEVVDPIRADSGDGRDVNGGWSERGKRRYRVLRGGGGDVNEPGNTATYRVGRRENDSNSAFLGARLVLVPDDRAEDRDSANR